MNEALTNSLATALPPQYNPPGQDAQVGTNFDQFMESQGNATGNIGSPSATLESTEPASAGQGSASVDEIAQTRESETRVLTLDHAGKVDYFAERIEKTSTQLLKVRRDMARQPNRFERSAVQAFDSCNAQYKELSTFLDEFASGRKFEQKELLAMQIRSHQIMQSVEILNKTVEQTVSGMKTIFQTNV